jgi:hypothetical protein
MDSNTVCEIVKKQQEIIQRLERKLDENTFNRNNNNNSLLNNNILERVNTLESQLTDLSRSVSDKLDESILEELMKHLITRNELYKVMENFIEERKKLEESKKVSHQRNIRINKTVNNVASNTDIVELKMNPDLKNLVGLEEKLSTLVDDFDQKLFSLSKNFDDQFECLSKAVQGVKVLSICQYKWTNGKLINGRIIWNEEFCNTDNEIFSRRDANIKIRKSGVYQLKFAIFSRGKPSLKVIVNGESIMSAIHSPAYIVHHGNNPSTINNSSSVTGISFMDFLNIKGDSTISLEISLVSEKAEGFIEISTTFCQN